MTFSPASRRAVFMQWIVLALLLLSAGYFRFTGLYWGDYSYPHPDERFLIWVVSDIAPVEDAAAYFDTDNSSLNPINRGHGFYVYGDFPVIITRYAAEWTFEQVGWTEILQMGRGLSALLDLFTVLVVYLIGSRLAGWKVGALAGFFSAAAVLQIQQAHFFTADAFAVFFSTLTIYFGVLLATEPADSRPGESRWRILLLALLYGAAVGMAMACKINTVPVAGLLPVALVIRYLRLQAVGRIPPGQEWKAALRLAAFAAAGGLVALLVFRVAMPYAFGGPGFFGMIPDERWLKNIRELSAQSAGDVDFPPALQWARRSHLFSLQNLMLWGLGMPLGLLAWFGFFVFIARAVGRIRLVKAADASSAAEAAEMAGASDATAASAAEVYHAGERIPPARVQPAWWRGLVRGAFPGVLLVWLWTAAYFLWQSMSWNPTMRYQLPIYPSLALLAAWGLGSLWRNPPERVRRLRPWRAGVAVAGAIVLVLTLAWAFAFTRIYTRPEARVAASQWIFDNVPGPLNLEATSINPSGEEEEWQQLLPVPRQAALRQETPYLVQFTSVQSGLPSEVNLPALRITALTARELLLKARIYDPAQPQVTLAAGEVNLPTDGFGLEQLELPVVGLSPLETGRDYTLSLALDAPGGTDVVTDPESSLGSLVQIDGQITLDLYGQVQTIPVPGSQSGPVTLQLAEGGTLRQVRLPEESEQDVITLQVEDAQTGQLQAALGARLPQNSQPVLRLDPPLTLQAGVSYLVTVSTAMPGQPLPAGQTAQLDFLDQLVVQYLPETVQLARPQEPLWTVFSARESGQIQRVSVPYAVQQEAGAPAGVQLELYNGRSPDQPLAVARAELPADAGAQGAPLVFTFDQPVEVSINETYSISLVPDGGALAVRGSAPANETTWDMSLPFRLDNYDPYGGIYRGDLNMEMYWDDNPDKLQRFLNILDQADYIFISSNRQWGTTTRIPERYPLTTRYYRELLGCPPERDVIWCYNVAEEGTFEGRLGFELAQVITSYPNLGPIEINTQFAEEAFTVYDHPKVFIFKKQADYDPGNSSALLGSVDLRRVVHLTPRRSGDWKDLLLPAWMWTIQQAGGTWAALFPPEGLLNRAPWLAAIVWYLFLGLLGLLTYPLLRMALPGLPDRGYSLARTAGLVLLAYLAWIGGSLGVAVTRPLLGAIFTLIALAGLLLGYIQGDALAAEWRARRGYFLAVEGVALGLFLLYLLIRLGNPDLWHPVFGGEKPMDFSYFNAVLRSTVFPPYDPWFAGGYINYYYYGFVLVGMPVKLLGIQPSVAYNLILPALFMLVGVGVFGVAVNLISAGHRPARGELERRVEGAVAESADAEESPSGRPIARRALAAGLVAVLALLILGNLGTVRMYWQGVQRLAVSDTEFQTGTLAQRLSWAAQGTGKLLSGEARALPYYPGDWYWKPSRAIQPESGNEITEFPFFTFLYADLHAHLMALPVTILVIGWALGVMLGRGCWGQAGRRGRRYGGLSFGLALLFGALATGLLRPANTWDQYTYLALAALALIYGQVQAPPSAWGKRFGWLGGRWTRALLAALLLVALSMLLYRPFDAWFQQGYNALEPWAGPTTQLSSYLVHWGLFLFVIAAWLFQETVDWMAATPLSALGRFRAYRGWIAAGAALLALAIIGLALTGVVVALVAAPIGIWVTLLLLRPGQPAARRAVLFMVGTAMALTLAVELVAVKGDIGRMNTVFKFYYQAWTLLALGAAAGLVWLWPRLSTWRSGWRTAWTAALAALVIGAALFPLNAARAKILDRMVADAPHTLDGMQFMNHARYSDGLTAETIREMDLSQDYRAIRWMQANVSGTPVIVEANTPEYRHWGTRFTIYTGLPGVIGWNWHQRQQRTITPDTWVYTRIEDVHTFYRTTSPERAAEFLRLYNVRYVIFGQLERIIYGGPGLDKFEQLNGTLWDKVYEEGETVIYRVK